MDTMEILTAVMALVSIIAVVCSVWHNSRITNADFIFRLRNDFYSDENKFIMFFIENDSIEFKENKEQENKSYFEIKKNDVDKLPEQFKIFKTFAEKSNYAIHIQDMDNFVLGYLDDIGEFWKRKVIDIEYIFSSFGYAIIKVNENEAIRKYICWCRLEKDKISKNSYKLFENIVEEIEELNK